MSIKLDKNIVILVKVTIGAILVLAFVSPVLAGEFISLIKILIEKI